MNSNSSSQVSQSSNLNARELVERLQNGENLVMLDVREPIEFHTFNIGGTNIPLAQLIARIDELKLEKDQEIIVTCKVGMRSATAQSILQEMGYTQVKNLEGGILAVQRLNR